MTWSHTHCTYHCSNVQYSQCYSQDVPSVLWHCWLGGRKGIRPVKTEWWGAGMVVCLKRGADLHTAQLMPLPLTVSCFSKIRIGFTFLVLGSPGKRAVKQVCVCVLFTRWQQWYGAVTKELVLASRSWWLWRQDTKPAAQYTDRKYL